MATSYYSLQLKLYVIITLLMKNESESGENKVGKHQDENSSMSLLVTNIRGFRQGCSDLAQMANFHSLPHFLCNTETHLENDSLQSGMCPEGYVSVARKD